MKIKEHQRKCRPLSSQLNCKNHSVLYLALEICVSTTCFSLYPCSFLVPSALLAYLKSASQIPNLYNDLHMQKSRICSIKYVINKKVLEKYYWGHNYYAGCFLFTIGIVCFFIFAVCLFHHLWHKKIFFLFWKKILGRSSFLSNWLKSSNENREVVSIFIMFRIILRSHLTQIQCSYKFNKICKGNSSNSCEKNVINRSQNKCHFEICQLLMDS